MMADHHTPFPAPMIRALLDGRKTQTRLILKPKRGVTLGDFSVDMGARGIGRAFALPRDKLADPKYRVGDRLWVRERDPALWARLCHRWPALREYG